MAVAINPFDVVINKLLIYIFADRLSVLEVLIFCFFPFFQNHNACERFLNEVVHLCQHEETIYETGRLLLVVQFT